VEATVPACVSSLVKAVNSFSVWILTVEELILDFDLRFLHDAENS
jgi:hypothetical protein